MTDYASDRSRVWLVRAGTNGELSDHFREDGRISIGYDLVDDLTSIAKWPDIRSALYKNNRSATRPLIDQIWQFLWAMQTGDLILTPTSPGFSQVMVGKVSAQMPWFDEEAATRGAHAHRRKVNWSAELLELRPPVVSDLRLRNVRRTVYMIAENDIDFWIQVARVNSE